MEYNEQDGRIQQKYKISNKTKRCFEILIFQFLLFSSVSINWDWHIWCVDELFEILKSILKKQTILYIVHRLAQRHSFAYVVTWRRMNQFEWRTSGGKTFSFVSERKISFISLVLKSIVLMFHYTQLENSSSFPLNSVSNHVSSLFQINYCTAV